MQIPENKMENRKYKNNVLVTLADAKFLDQAKQVFSSVYHKAGWDGDYLLITCNLPETDRTWFESRGIIVFDNPLLADTDLNSSCPPIHLSKFYLFSSYFKNWQKIIFLDADIIIRSSLDDLLKTEGLAATWGIPMRLKDELLFQNYKERQEFLKKYPALNLKDKTFSSGVMVIDSKIIKEETFSDIISLYNWEKKVLLYNEESTLNLYFYKHWQELPLCFNYLPHYFSGIYKLKEEKWPNFIIHFAYSLVKPWEKESPYYEEWLDNFLRADNIEASKVLAPKVGLARNDLEKYFKKHVWQKYIFRKYIYREFKFLKIDFISIIDRQIGRCGIFIKSYFPSLYYFLKKCLK